MLIVGLKNATQIKDDGLCAVHASTADQVKNLHRESGVVRVRARAIEYGPKLSVKPIPEGALRGLFQMMGALHSLEHVAARTEQSFQPVRGRVCTKVDSTE